MQPWPYGMPSSINPFVIFLGPSPGNSPPVSDDIHEAPTPYTPYGLPTFARAHEGLYVRDTRKYWDRVRKLGSMIVQARSPELSETQAHALIGQLNLGTGQFGKATDAPLDPRYCQWVPEVVLDYLRPSYVILLGLRALLGRPGTGFDPLNRLKIDWNNPDQCFPFTAHKTSQYTFRVWNRKRPDGKGIRFVQWPQHPSRAPMTKDSIWKESACEFILHAGVNQSS